MKQLKELLTKPGSSLVDVRSAAEFAADHISGAINIPLEELPFRIEEVRNMTKPIVVYCRSGNRSSMAINMLKQAGINDLYNGGGLNDMKNFILN